MTLNTNEDLVLVFVNDHCYSMRKAGRSSASWFGGPRRSNAQLQGVRFGPRRLHHICHLHEKQIPEVGGEGLAILYGMCFEGLRLEYCWLRSRVRIDKMRPRRSTPGWPYPDYPVLLPYIPLEVGDRRQLSWGEFMDQLPNMPVDQPAEVVVVVPSAGTIGVSMWGAWGDGVVIVAECNPKTGAVCVYNVCD